MTTTNVHIHIDLAALTARTQRALKAATNLVAIGLKSTQGITDEELSLPGVTMHHSFDSNNPWSTEDAKKAWQLWILRNGFRDVAETVGGTLEEVQRVLAYWQLLLLQRSRGSLSGEDWHDFIDGRGRQFHRRTLPQKIEFLEKQYGFTLGVNLVRQVLAINSVRNCLVHRGGVITSLDAGETDHLVLEWSALVVLIIRDGREEEVQPPHYVEAGTEIGIATRGRAKAIAIGQPVEVTASEFARICWTMYVFAQSCAQCLEIFGKEMGFEFSKDVT